MTANTQQDRQRVLGFKIQLMLSLTWQLHTIYHMCARIYVRSHPGITVKRGHVQCGLTVEHRKRERTREVVGERGKIEGLCAYVRAAAPPGYLGLRLYTMCTSRG